LEGDVVWNQKKGWGKNDKKEVNTHAGKRTENIKEAKGWDRETSTPYYKKSCCHRKGEGIREFIK